MEQKDDTTVQEAAAREEVAEKSEEQHEEEEVKEEEELEVEEGRRELEEEEEVRSDNKARGGGGTSCNICGELMTGGGHELIRHLADVHWRNVWCYDCSMGFNFESEFERHLMQHAWENPGVVVVKDINGESCGCLEVLRYRDYPSVFD